MCFRTTKDRRLRDRCQAVLMAARGRPQQQIVEDLGTTVRNVQRFQRSLPGREPGQAEDSVGAGQNAPGSRETRSPHLTADRELLRRARFSSASPERLRRTERIVSTSTFMKSHLLPFSLTVADLPAFCRALSRVVWRSRDVRADAPASPSSGPSIAALAPNLRCDTARPCRSGIYFGRRRQNRRRIPHYRQLQRKESSRTSTSPMRWGRSA